MKHKIFQQKNIFSNNISQKLSGIYGIIGENSDLNISNSYLSKKSYSDLVLNNSKFISNLSSQITIKTFNNSQIATDNNNYIVDSETSGSRVQFPIPFFQETDNKNTVIKQKSTILYPSDKITVSKEVVTNHISTFFLDFNQSILTHNLTFDIDKKNIVIACSSDNNNISAYNKINLNYSSGYYAYSIYNLIKNLPKSMNGYSYTFNFDVSNWSDHYSECLNFKDFHGGNLILNFNYIDSSIKEYPYHNTINFLNCDNIKINGNNNTFYASTAGSADFLRPIFSFDNCHTIEINNCNLQKCYYIDETTKDIKTFYSDIYFCGNSNKYETGGCIIFKNSNAILKNCSFVHRDGGSGRRI